MNYTVKITENATNYAQADIVELPDVYLHFGHLNFRNVRNAKTGRYDSVKGVDRFFGGMGEGSEFETWQDAIHTSLYDAYQCYDELKEGDTFLTEYRGGTKLFRCDGVHVIPVEG